MADTTAGAYGLRTSRTDGIAERQMYLESSRLGRLSGASRSVGILARRGCGKVVDFASFWLGAFVFLRGAFGFLLWGILFFSGAPSLFSGGTLRFSPSNGFPIVLWEGRNEFY
jgi:hypothetical protein